MISVPVYYRIKPEVPIVVNVFFYLAMQSSMVQRLSEEESP